MKDGDDGAYLLSSMATLWNLNNFDASNSSADVLGEQAVIYDKRGTKMFVLNNKKPVSDMETKFPFCRQKLQKKRRRGNGFCKMDKNSTNNYYGA